MSNTLILKLGATGDVVRTTPLLKHLAGEVSWITAAKNVPLLAGLTKTLRAFRGSSAGNFATVITTSSSIWKTRRRSRSFCRR